MSIREFIRVLPRIRIWKHGGYVAMKPRAGCMATTSILGVLLLVLLTRSLFGQVDAVLQIHGRDAAMTVANPTHNPLRVSIALFQDSTLTDSVPARISPREFTLAPGASQTVRLRLRIPAPPGSAFRLATTFTPAEEAPEQPRPTMRFILATRIITRVQAGP